MLNNSITSSKPTPITKQNWPENSEPLVSISCITFNHENFIRDAIEGFLIQRTTFPVEILIHDDASTDKTQEIIREYEEKYPFLIRPIYQKTNQYSQGNSPGKFNRERAKGKYYAICEGDDYWTDPLKLQKQVDFLEGNEEYVACFTNALYQNEITKSKRLFISNLKEGQVPTDSIILHGGGIYPTASLVFKNKLIPNELFGKFPGIAGDDLLIMLLAMAGKVNFLDETTCVYRRWSGGIYSMISNDKRRVVEHRKKNISGLLLFKDFYKNSHKKSIKKRISKESLFVLKNDGICKNRKLLFNLNIKDLLRLIFNLK